jgi:YegS/Rv2252/BmrU family lipid kinase
VLNPDAGGGRAARLKRAIEDSLAGSAKRPMLFVSQDAALARRIVDALPSGGRVVIVGGDGSVSQLLPSLVAGGHELGVVPLGSGNDTAHALGVGRLNWRDALTHALQAKAAPVDLGEVCWTNARGFEQRSLFLSSLCTGFDAAVTQYALSLPRWLRGKPRYLGATLLELLALRQFDMRTVIDGRAIHAGPVLLASTLNTRTYGAGMPMAPGAEIDDGQLDLVLADSMGLARVLALLPRMLVGRHLGQPGVIYQRFAHLALKADTPVPLAADGEFLGHALDIEVRVRPQTLSAVCNKESA